MHPVFVLAIAMMVDAWALPGAARILRAHPSRPRVVGRGPLVGPVSPQLSSASQRQ